MRLEVHLDEAKIQRRGMNAYISALKKTLAPEDPPLRLETWKKKGETKTKFKKTLEQVKKTAAADEKSEESSSDDEPPTKVRQKGEAKTKVKPWWQVKKTRPGKPQS